MPKWAPTPEWLNQDAVIIGGGPSLRHFDFSRLAGRNTIGCNDAFRLGPDVVKVCLFGDLSFLHRTEEELAKFPNRVATCCPGLMGSTLPWLLLLAREREGLHEGGKIGWNHSTGAAAINLALAFGSTRIFLLGFDMCRKGYEDHWHNYNERKIEDASFKRFQRGFGNVARDLGRFRAKVFNVTDGTSQLPYFHKMGFEMFAKYVPPQQRKPCLECLDRWRPQA